MSDIDAMSVLFARQQRKPQGQGASMPLGYVRELSAEDVAKLNSGEIPTLPRDEETVGNLGTVTTIKAKYHMLAMVLAAGASVARAAMITGYSEGTIYSIRSSPMFKELLAYYTSQKEHEFKDFYQKAAMVGLDAMEILHERMLADPTAISTKDLTKLMGDLMDRTILPSKGTGQQQAAPPPSPTNIIMFVDSPNAALPTEADKRLIEGKLSA